MHGLVINICMYIVPVVLLLIHHVMLGTSNNARILQALDGFGHANASQNWINAKTCNQVNK